MPTLTKDTLDHQGDIHRFLFRSKVVVIWLSAQDQFRALNPESLADMFLFLNSRLDDIDTACTVLFKEITK